MCEPTYVSTVTVAALALSTINVAPGDNVDTPGRYIVIEDD